MSGFKRVYKQAAIILLNTLVVFVVLNLVLGAGYLLHDAYVAHRMSKQTTFFDVDGSPVDNGKRSTYQLEWFDYNATREISPTLTAEMLDDFYTLGQKGFIYQPWCEFSEPPFASRHVSIDVDEGGIPLRRTLNPSTDQSKPVLNLFVLGGSTTFGYNVADEHTWPSYLSTVLNERAKSEGLNLQVRVMNYGRGYYDTSQEMALLIDLLKSGQRPGLVLFMDGVNWGGEDDVPYFTAEVERAVADAQRASALVGLRHLKESMKKWIPLLRFASSLKSYGQRKPTALNQVVVGELSPNQREHVAQVLERFKQNRGIIRQVALQYGAETMFFIQPDALYNYPIDLYRRALPASFLISREERNVFHEQMRKSQDTFYLGQLFDAYNVSRDRRAIVDDVHYNPAFNRFLAEHVAAYIDLKKSADSSTGFSSASTGAKRQIFHTGSSFIF